MVSRSPFAGDRNQEGMANEAKWNAAQAFLAASERENRSPGVKMQDANIAAHGTIESPQDFERRNYQQTAADSLDPSNPFGAARAHDEAHELEKARLNPGGVSATEIAGQTQRDVAGVQRQTGLDESADKLAGSMYNSDVEGQAKLESELANQTIGGSFPGGPKERGTAIEGFLTALDALRKRQAAVR